MDVVELFLKAVLSAPLFFVLVVLYGAAKENNEIVKWGFLGFLFSFVAPVLALIWFS